MTKRGVFDRLLANINKQLEQKNLMVKTVTKADGSITDTPRKPKGNKTFEVDDDNQIKQDYKPSVDKDASWVKKAGKTRYGFKKHNKQVAKTRYMVQRICVSMVRWFGVHAAKYVVIDKMHTQHVLESKVFKEKPFKKMKEFKQL